MEGGVWTHESKTRGPTVNSIAESFSINFLVKLFFNEHEQKELGNTLSAWKNFRVDLTWRMGFVNVRIEFQNMRNWTSKQKYNFAWKIENKRHCMGFLQKAKSCITRVCISVLCNAGIPSEYLPKQMQIWTFKKSKIYRSSCPEVFCK